MDKQKAQRVREAESVRLEKECEEVKQSLRDFSAVILHVIDLLDVLAVVYDRNQRAESAIIETRDWLNDDYGKTIDTDRSNEIRKLLVEALE